jgi:hypothetical protein
MWRNTETGDLFEWQMNGSAVTAVAPVYKGLATAWQVVSRGDFDGDGRTDLMFRNTSTQQAMIWLMSGMNIKFMSGPLPAAGFELVGVGDFDGNSLPTSCGATPRPRISKPGASGTIIGAVITPLKQFVLAVSPNGTYANQN